MVPDVHQNRADFVLKIHHLFISITQSGRKRAIQRKYRKKAESVHVVFLSPFALERV